MFKENKILNEEEIRQRRIKLDSLMRNLIVTLSSRCNLDCIMCEVRKIEWDIPRKTLREVINLFPYLEGIIWQGGEPFLLNYFADIFERAAKFPNLKQMIVTNGLLITEAWAKKLVENNVELTFSIDGITKKVYEHIREKARFEDVMRNIKMIRDAKCRCDFSKMSLRLHVVVMKSNYHQLEKFIDFAGEYGFNAIHFISILGDQNQEENIFSLRDREALDYIENIRAQLEEQAKRYNIELLNALPRCLDNTDKNQVSEEIVNNNDMLFCRAPWQQLNLDPGGGVRPGCLCLKNVGSILENSIEDLWNNETMQEYRMKIIERDFASICNSTCLSVQRQEGERKGHKRFFIERTK